MLVSIIVPVYNVSAYIEKSIQSICDQNFNDYEIILVNDGTKDDSVVIAEKILESSNVVYRIINKTNGGLPTARNKGLEVAKGEYVCFVDSDDILSKNHIKSLYDISVNNGLDASFSLFEETYESNPYGKENEEEKKNIYSKTEIMDLFLIRRVKIHCCSLLIKRDFLNKNDLKFNDLLRYGEDIEFLWRLLPSLDYIGCNNQKSYKYLQRSNSLMTAQNVERVDILINEIKQMIIDNKKEYPEYNYIWRYLLGKTSLAFYRTFSESSSYNTFIDLSHSTKFRGNIKGVFGIKSIKLNLLALILYINPRAFFCIINHNKERKK